MRTRLLFWDEDEVRKKKTLILVLAFLLIPLLLGLYAAIGPEGGLVAEVTPTALPSPSAIVTATPLIPIATATPTAGATPAAKATVTPVPPEPTVAPPVTSIALEPTPTSTVAPSVPTSTATSTATPVPPKPTAILSATSAVLEPTATPTVAPVATLAAPVITAPPDGSILKSDRPTLAGTAPPNTTVQVYDDGSLVGTAAADGQGDWTLVADEPLEPGEHTVTAVASDDAGKTSDISGAVTFTVAIEHLPVTGGGSLFERWLDRFLSIALP